jgi:hypothetical protein
VTIELALALLGLGSAAVALYGVHRYRTALNPLTFGTVYETVMTTLFSGLIAYTLLPIAPYSADDMVKTCAVSGAYLLGTTIPYLSRGPGPARAFGAVLGALRLRSEGYGTSFRPAKFAALVGASVSSYIALAIAGGGGTAWLTDTRTAYIHNRSGAGQFWLLSLWFLMTTMLYYLWSRRPRGLELLFVLGLFTGGAYLTGSKYVILCAFITGLAYYNFLVRPLSTTFLFLSGIAAVAGFFGLLFFQSAMTALNFLSYFEHFDITTQFLARFDEYGYRCGAGWLSELWFYVPRALYPDKPLEYGGLLVPAHLFPGAYEQGYAPGFLSWSLGYLDFGTSGVFVAGYLKGLGQRAVFEYFLAHRRSFFAFLFMMQFCLWSMLAYATITVTVIWSVATAVLLRLVLVHRQEPPRLRGAAVPEPTGP